jgi:hypothetical protein
MIKHVIYIFKFTIFVKNGKYFQKKSRGISETKKNGCKYAKNCQKECWMLPFMFSFFH